MKIIYSDGACSGNPGHGGWATLIFNENQLLKVLAGYQENTTNNRMEIIAALNGLNNCNPVKKPLFILTVNTYVMELQPGFPTGKREIGKPLTRNQSKIRSCGSNWTG